MSVSFDTYLRKLRETPLEEQTEHTGRSALEDLLNQFAARALAQGVAVQHEPRREADKGAPDFKIKRQGMILGYVEVKEIGANLDKVLKSDQIKRYRELSDNILLTDYLNWIWIDRERVKGRATLAYPTDLESRTIRVVLERAQEVGGLIEAFFSEPPQGIGRAQQLALALATRSKLLRDFLTRELTRQAKEHREGRLHALYEVFRQQVFHELSVKEFADAFAQMLAYGLFLARLNADDDDIVTLENVRRFIPGSFRLIRELVRFLEEMNELEYFETRWVVDEILSIVNGLDLSAIHGDLSFRQRKAISRNVRAGDEEEHRLFERDPFIYFYEDFLKAYDKETRKGRGVYYTPPPVVNFIVRAVDDILKDSFGIGEGLADYRRVTVLDFACGTGTFLLEVFQRIFDNIGGSDTGRAEPIVREHILRNLFGFEYLIAPYTIAHLKLSQYLKDKGHPLHGDERLQVFLTNTLEPVEPQKNLLLPAIAAEAEAAQMVKERPILVITGNPPYSYESKNTGPIAVGSVAPYYICDGRPLGERNPRGLQDDYVKFVRFAQIKMDAVDEGIVGVITNHSWLDNPTFRGMRQSLMRSFDQIYVLDLHGNAKKKEHAPDGSKDENVFDIEQGVAISLFVKKPGLERGVWRGDFWGKRLEKYRNLAHNSVKAISLNCISPAAPYYLFTPVDRDIEEEYQRGWLLQDLFALRSVGIITARDRLTVHFDTNEAWQTVQKFSNCDPQEARQEFKLGADTTEWSIKDAQTDLLQSGPSKAKLRKITYHPFDDRWTYYTGQTRGFMSRPRQETMSAMHQPNLALIATRITKETGNVFISSNLISHKAASVYDKSYAFPFFGHGVENLSPIFRHFIDGRYDHHFSPEEILGLVYAVLHARAYRARYAEFLRIDFPRIPFPERTEDFEALSKLGWALVQAHLLRGLPRRDAATYHGKGDHTVEHVRWSVGDQTISINKTQGFRPVPEEVWNFHIGGYQVIDKYLKSRKGRRLSLDEIGHVGAIADSLAFTIDQMKLIDEAYGKAFPDRG
jgi:hypothetical protein